jgi:PHD/YefM family antitoxin component YafN of YafNO toxin-antitoxin module
MVPKHISNKEAKEAGDNFVDLLVSIHDTEEPLIIEKEDQPMVAVVSHEAFQKYEAIRKAVEKRFWNTVETIQTRNVDEDPDDLLNFITEIVDEVRQEQHEKQR